MYVLTSLRFLIEHLVRITDLQIQNKMTPENVATVFGPTLIHSGRLDLDIHPYIICLDLRRGSHSQIEASEVFAQRAVVEFMLLNHNKELVTNENHSNIDLFAFILVL